MSFFAGGRPFTYKTFDVEDEFLTGAASDVSTATYGSMGWTKGGTGVYSSPTSTDAHPGIITLTVNNNTGSLKSTTTVITAEVAYFCAIIGLRTSIANMRIQIGLVASAAATDKATQGTYFNFTPATDAFWHTVTRGASNITDNPTGVTVTLNNWYLLEFTQSTGAVNFFINNVLVNTHDTNLSITTKALALVLTSTAVEDKLLDIDYLRMGGTILGQRWT